MHFDRTDLILNGTSGVQNWAKRSKLLIFLFLFRISLSKFWYNTVTQAKHPSFYSFWMSVLTHHPTLERQVEVAVNGLSLNKQTSNQWMRR